MLAVTHHPLQVVFLFECFPDECFKKFYVVPSKCNTLVVRVEWGSEGFGLRANV